MLRVMIVEDEDIIRRGLVETLDWEAMGAAVVGEAGDGDEALPLIKELSPDVVLTDIKMQRMDGLAMVQALRQDGNMTPVVFLTSYADFDYVREALRLKAVDYLLKPVEEEEISHVLAKLFQQDEGAAAVPFARELDKAAKSKNPYVLAVWQAIMDNYQQHLSLEQVAEKQGVSISYISRKLKEETGNTFGTLLTMYRLQQAVQLLQVGTWRVYEVAEQAGFSDYKNFCQVFKRYLGTTPSAVMQASIS